MMMSRLPEKLRLVRARGATVGSCIGRGQTAPVDQTVHRTDVQDCSRLRSVALPYGRSLRDWRWIPLLMESIVRADQRLAEIFGLFHPAFRARHAAAAPRRAYPAFGFA